MTTIYVTPKQYRQLKQSLSLIDTTIGDTIDINTEVDVSDGYDTEIVEGEHFRFEIVSPVNLLKRQIKRENNGFI